MKALNGKGRTALDWIRIVERLTLQRGLRVLTMLPWQKVLADKFLLRRNRAWCPLCLQEQRHARETVYEHLLWTLTSVNFCPYHRTKLQTEYPHCYRSYSPIAHKLIPGHCSRCLGWLGHPDTKRALGSSLHDEDELKYQMWVANEMGLLVAAAHKLKSDPPRERISNFLKMCPKQICNGNTTAFARYVGITPGVYHDWRSMKRYPHINLLLKVCYRSLISFSDLLTNDHLLFDATSINRLSQLTGTSDLFNRDHKITKTLLSALEEKPPPSVRQVARRLGFKEPLPLYLKHADLCKTLTAKNRDAHSPRVRRPGKRICHEASDVYNALQEALREEVLPSLEEIARRLGYACAGPLKYRFPDLCQLILSRRSKGNAKTALENALAQTIPPSLIQVAKTVGYVQPSPLRARYPDLCDKLVARQVQRRAHERNQLRTSLESILVENPPPGLNEVAKRFGYRLFRDSSSLLIRYFPELCKAIKVRHKQYRKSKLNNTILKLNQALSEEPPPSPKEVVSRLEYSSSYISVKFPKEREAIKKRHGEFKRRLSAERKAKAKARIKQIALDLHASGRYPAPTQVMKVCNGPIGLTTAELTLILRDVRLQLGLRRSG
jgi:hypothetical protein